MLALLSLDCLPFLSITQRSTQLYEHVLTHSASGDTHGSGGREPTVPDISLGL
jgi:hypothetical protein